MIKTTSISAIQISTGWILVLPVAHNWAWAGSRFVEHRQGVSREAKVMVFPSEKEALAYAADNVLAKKKTNTTFSVVVRDPECVTKRLRQCGHKHPTITTANVCMKHLRRDLKDTTHPWWSARIEDNATGDPITDEDQLMEGED